MTVYEQTVLDALDTLLDGRTPSNWLSIVEIMDELTCAYNDNPVRLRTRGLCGETFVRWSHYVDRNQARGFTYSHIARALRRSGYRHRPTMRNGHSVTEWGPRR